MLAGSAYTVGAYGAVSLQEIKAFLNKSVNVKVNGVKWQGKDANGNVAYPITYKGTTYLPVKAVGEALNVNVGWDDPSNSVLIGEGASVTTVGSSRRNPAPLRTNVNIKGSSYSEKFTGIASIDNVIRGEAAWEKIKAKDSDNKPAGDGYEYILATITVKVVSTEKEDQAIRVSTSDFNLVSSNGKEYGSVYYVIEPDPELDAFLYAGGTTTGYAVFKVSVDDKTPLLTYGRNSDGTSGSWFKVTE
jgi:hypothetical protein